MKEIKGKYGPEAFGLFNHGTSGKHLETPDDVPMVRKPMPNRLMPIAAVHVRQRIIPLSAPIIGSPENTDIRDTRCLVLIGSHIGENMHNSQVQEMSEAIDNGATIITVDPRFSTAAGHSTYWLPIKPATDIALLMAWIHVLIYEDLYNKEFC